MILLCAISNLSCKKDDNPLAPATKILVQGMNPVAGGKYISNSIQLTISPFNIDKYEVTYELWTEVRNWGLTHGYTDLVAGRNGSNSTGTNNPVAGVSWYDAVKWCNARSEKEGVTPEYYTDSTQLTIYRTGKIDLTNTTVKWKAGGCRLPTSAEFEFAAMGGLQSKGYLYSGSNSVDSVAWTYVTSPGVLHPVGLKLPNEVGLFDMSGNANEWCWDWMNGNNFEPINPIDPKGPSRPTKYRLLRGGTIESMSMTQYLVTSAFTAEIPDIRMNGTDFRCVQD
jgi:sulfatase modifying factor 1